MIATAEQIIRYSNDKEEVQKAQEQIITLSSQLSIFDMLELDELLQEILEVEK